MIRYCIYSGDVLEIRQGYELPAGAKILTDADYAKLAALDVPDAAMVRAIFDSLI